MHGGEGGIRTHGTLTRTPVFETSTFNHSVTSPYNIKDIGMHEQTNFQYIDIIYFICLTKNRLVN